VFGEEPDLVVASSGFNVPAVAADQYPKIDVPTGLTEARWVKAADLLPGTPTLVRDAIISVENGPVLALWQPGNDPVAAPSSLTATRFGLALSSFAAILIASLATREARPIETLLFALGLSAAAVLLFVKALALPVPIWPGAWF